jgi:hypothetical protein
MHRIVTRLRTMIAPTSLGFTAIVPAEGAYPVSMPARGNRPNRRWTPAMPLRLANGVLADRHESNPEASIVQPQPEAQVWSWQGAEGLDKPLAYSR